MPMLAIPAALAVAGTAGAGALGIGATTALGTAGLSASIFGATSSALSGYESSQYQAQVAKNNQNIAEQNAAYAQQAGNQAVQQQQLKNSAQMGAIKATLAANGLDIGTGTSLNLQRSQGILGQENVDTTQTNTQKTVSNDLNQATNYGNEAQIYQQGSIQSLIGGATSVATKWSGLTAGVGTFSGTNGANNFFNDPNLNLDDND